MFSADYILKKETDGVNWSNDQCNQKFKKVNRMISKAKKSYWLLSWVEGEEFVGKSVPEEGLVDKRKYIMTHNLLFFRKLFMDDHAKI